MQRTILQATSFSGIGLHSGQNVTVNLLPQPENTGIVFRRNLAGNLIDIPALASNVSDTTMSSCLSVHDEGSQQTTIMRTVEHFMSAIASIGIDNLLVEVDADELPILDGSAEPFIKIIESSGVVEQGANKKFIKIIKPIEVVIDDKMATLTPHDSFEIDFNIDFDHKVFKATEQHFTINFAQDSFYERISKARTFGFLKDIEYLRANDLALGGSLDNAIVIDDEKIVNEEGLRFAGEFVKHKILDAVGDLYLAGHQIIGKLTAFKSGHHLNNVLVRKVLANPDCYQLVDYSQLKKLPLRYPSSVVVAEAS